MGDSLDHRSHRNHGSMIVFSETWLLSTMSNYQSVIFLKKYIYNYPSSFHLGGGVGATHFVVALRPPILYGKTCHFCGSAHPEVFPPASGEIPELSGDFNGNITNSKGKTHCHLRLSGHGNTQLGYTVICHGSEFTDYPMFWQLLAFNGNLNRYYTFRERESETPKKLPTFFFPPGHIVISYNLYHHGLITLFGIFWWVLKFFS